MTATVESRQETRGRERPGGGMQQRSTAGFELRMLWLCVDIDVILQNVYYTAGYRTTADINPLFGIYIFLFTF